MGQQIQLWQHNDSIVSTIMVIVRLHPRLLKVVFVKFKTKGSVLNQQKGHLRDLIKECHNIETVRLSVIEDPKKSYRKRAQTLNI